MYVINYDLHKSVTRAYSLGYQNSNPVELASPSNAHSLLSLYNLAQHNECRDAIENTRDAKFMHRIVPRYRRINPTRRLLLLSNTRFSENDQCGDIALVLWF